MKRWAVPAILAIGLGVGIGWRLNYKKQQAAQQDSQRKKMLSAPPVVELGAVGHKDLITTFEGVGSVESPLNVKLAPKVTGRITYLQVHEGDSVSMGEKLVEIDRAQVEADVAQAAANLAEAQQRLDQAAYSRNPVDVGILTQVAQSRAAVDTAAADYNQVHDTLAQQLAQAAAAVQDAQGKVDSAAAALSNSDAAIRSANANVENAQSKYNRLQGLYKQGFVAAQDVDDASTALAVQTAALDVARGGKSAMAAQQSSAIAQLHSAQQAALIVKAKSKSDLAAAHARLVQAQAGLKNSQANRAQRPAYNANLLALRSAVVAAKAAMDSAAARRADTTLYSPINGVVTARSMDPGATATAGQQVLEVQALNPIWVAASVQEEQSHAMVRGMLGTVTLDALPARPFTGRVVQVNGAADATSRQVTVRIQLNNPALAIKPGMYGHVSIVTHRIANAVVAPREAVRVTKGGSQVTVVGPDNIAHNRDVVTGPQDAASIEILSGVQPGDQVVTLSGGPIKDLQVVRVSGARKRTASSPKPSSIQ